MIFFFYFFFSLVGRLEILGDAEERRGAGLRRGNGWLGGGNGGGGGGSGEGCGTESSFNMHGGRTAEDNHAASFRTRHIDKCCKGAGGRRLAGSGSGGGGTERCGVAVAAEDAVSCCSNGIPAPNIQGSEEI